MHHSCLHPIGQSLGQSHGQGQVEGKLCYAISTWLEELYYKNIERVNECWGDIQQYLLFFQFTPLPSQKYALAFSLLKGQKWISIAPERENHIRLCREAVLTVVGQVWWRTPLEQYVSPRRTPGGRGGRSAAEVLTAKFGCFTKNCQEQVLCLSPGLPNSKPKNHSPFSLR